ncbi:HypC/HybG/HupF family hydrogenase formation chaperone [Photobacterium kishitanii]|uniref:HypC/HybG/HupF family hydrogenase formation chaperone n=1 Tax=Photobacterium kishitanii TaxID=318456 RepID=A0A2T3QY64_9GAMM|nr:HypC/HybG/HupF family hydrogenase formation chaperone [Photobacterium kishitanii]KJG10150.1 hydrogenase assembly protein HupF [Photobacterium kishitanii]KJG59356.1 hydrogenase assembly protein HupF [Photobacterium kishitanii]KJG62351.1 hydrogenase assembly protein HupF [Photobacterium kishitanii]KJG67509.1 hydrogenase assembly protein HupF [Photobacterium kishitanii]KJG70177.1 hydrogenase assembly protein HupF [Photobacterium kishitanii]
MCLSIPSQVVEVHEDNTVTVDTMGVKRRVSCHLLMDELVVGEYVLIHIGFVMSRINDKDAQESLEMYQFIMDESGPLPI